METIEPRFIPLKSGFGTKHVLVSQIKYIVENELTYMGPAIVLMDDTVIHFDKESFPELRARLSLETSVYSWMLPANKDSSEPSP